MNQMLSGTLGAVLRDQNGKLYALSANHVLSVNGRIKGGTPICAPSPEDDLHPPQSGHGTIIATAEPIVIPLNRNDGGSANLVDCAIVELLSPDKVDPVFMEDLHVTDHTAPVRGMKVVKYGKKTGSTCGTITDIHADILVDYSFGSFRFVDQILIESDDDDKPFAADGDSGAVIVDIDSGKAVGLLFAPVGKLTAACPMPAVIEQLSQKLGCSLGFAPSPEPATST